MPQEWDCDIQYDIDEAILDYLLYTTTELLLKNASSANRERLQNAVNEQDLRIQMVDSFLVLFRLKYSENQVSSILQFRLRLLKFTKLFTSRFAITDVDVPPETLQALRKSHSEKARDFLSHFHGDEDFDLSPFEVSPSFTPELQLKYRHKLAPSTHYGSPASVSLLDTIPSFMALSAAENLLEDNEVTERWMGLAARYMAQAALEQYIACGVQGTAKLSEAFAYAFDVESTAEMGTDDLLIASLFWGGQGSGEVEGWKGIRHHYLQLLIPPNTVGLQEHLIRVEADLLSFGEFENMLLEFLGGLLHAQIPPLYVQIENGDIDGFSKDDSRFFVEEILKGPRGFSETSKTSKV